MIGSILLSAGFIQSLFLGLYFFFQGKHKRQYSLYLSFFFFFLSLTMACNLIYFSGNLNEFPHLIKLGYFFGFCIAPLFSFIITRYFVIPKESIYWEGFTLVVPLLFLVYEAPFFLLSGEDKFLSLTKMQSNEIFSETNLFQIFILFFSFVVFLRTYIRFRLEMGQFAKDLYWEGKIFENYLLLLLIWLCFCILFCIILPGKTSESISNLGFSIWILGFAWHRVYLDKKESHDLPNHQSEEVKYQKSYLPEIQMMELGKQLENILEDKEFLFDGDLNLTLIASNLGISTHSTSQVCNRYFGKSLIEIIQEKRIEHAKDALKNSDDTILRIGFAVGFNSKNSFIRVFKELTQLTPSEYRKKYKP
ncbi:helix-turn-helix domain-containing protein [Leptospira limi]|uniref:AraC family transcriptional regulator n=1 Tax=Leptospira limi TaxID=2950023 RepID=A0ABT3M144_9LEPT|nr:AraC family transcriptional regulator [Leptospira limi]MCW7463695.1 AraC family transcriptional regulator [Leptospira limi]